MLFRSPERFKTIGTLNITELIKNKNGEIRKELNGDGVIGRLLIKCIDSTNIANDEWICIGIKLEIDSYTSEYRGEYIPRIHFVCYQNAFLSNLQIVENMDFLDPYTIY